MHQDMNNGFSELQQDIKNGFFELNYNIRELLDAIALF